MRITELAAGPARLRLSPEAGGRVSALHLARDGSGAAVPLLHPFPEATGPDELLHWPKGGIYPLIPYGNRIRDARLSLPDGVENLLPHSDAAPHTLHGHAHRRPWTLGAHSEAEAVLTLRHAGDAEWPWRFTASQRFLLRPGALAITLELRNDDARTIPAGLGLHPYFLHAPADRLRFRAETDWPLTEDLLGGPPVPAPGDHEAARPLPDGTVTLYRGGWDGRCAIGTAAGTVLLSADGAFGHLVVHRPAGTAYLCVEPSTHAPDGFNLAQAGMPGAGRVMLPPGGTLHGEVTISLHA